MRVLFAVLILLSSIAPAFAQGVGYETTLQTVAGAVAVREQAGHCPGITDQMRPQAPGSTSQLCVVWEPRNLTAGTWLLVVNATATGGATVAPSTLTLTLVPNATGSFTGTSYGTLSITYPASGDRFAVNGTLVLSQDGAQRDAKTFALDVPVGAGPGGPSMTTLVAVAAVGVAATGLGAWMLLRRRQVRAAPRSSVLQQAEMEKKLEKAKAPEEKAAIKAEMRQVEAERSLTREAQIVEAKIADVRKGLDRLKERHDAGQLTQHQYDQMRSKRESQLEDLEREMERLRGPDG